jgi:hypothetical protein
MTSWASAQPTIDVGTHELDANTTGQQVNLNVAGSTDIEALNLRVQVGSDDNVDEAGEPAITDYDILNGTIFDGNMLAGGDRRARLLDAQGGNPGKGIGAGRLKTAALAGIGLFAEAAGDKPTTAELRAIWDEAWLEYCGQDADTDLPDIDESLQKAIHRSRHALLSAFGVSRDDWLSRLATHVSRQT